MMGFEEMTRDAVRAMTDSELLILIRRFRLKPSFNALRDHDPERVDRLIEENCTCEDSAINVDCVLHGHMLSNTNPAVLWLCPVHPTSQGPCCEAVIGCGAMNGRDTASLEAHNRMLRGALFYTLRELDAMRKTLGEAQAAGSALVLRVQGQAHTLDGVRASIVQGFDEIDGTEACDLLLATLGLTRQDIEKERDSDILAADSTRGGV